MGGRVVEQAARRSKGITCRSFQRCIVFLVPNHHALSIVVGEFDAAAPRNVPRFADEVNTSANEFVVLAMRAVALQGQ
jgi:hypothetical protein